MRRRLLPASVIVAVAISGCGHDEFDPKDSIADDLARIKRDPKPGRTTSAVERLNGLRASHKEGGPVAK